MSDKENSKGLISAMDKNVGSILATLIAAFILGTLAMIYSSDKSAQVMETKLAHMVGLMGDLKLTISTLQNKVDVNTRDRWTRGDHRDYAKDINARIDKVEDRLLRIEVNNLSDKKLKDK